MYIIPTKLNGVWQRKLIIFVVFCLTFWAFAVPAYFVHAAQLTSVKDTLSTSVISANAIHTINFTTPTGIASSQTLTLQFTSFTNVTTIVAADITTFTINGSGQTVSTQSATNWGIGTSGTTITLSAPTSGTPAAAGAAVVLVIGGTNKITNPSSTGSYQINIAGTMADSGATQDAITNSVTVTATVNTTLTFTITGVNSGTAAVNGEASPATTSVDTRAASCAGTIPCIPWGTLTTSAKIAQLQLATTTNAVNGYAVTVQASGALTSGNGAVINLFKDGAATATPTAWTAPLGTLGTTATYGHYGITTDSTEGSSEFIATKYAGNLVSAPRQIAANTGPCDGTTVATCLATAQFKIQLTALQAAATDYTNSLVFVCTPTF